MSLINQMLKDLDKRRRQGESGTHKGIPAGVEQLSKPVQIKSQYLLKLSLSYKWQWLLLLVVGIFLGILSWHYSLSIKKPLSNVPLTTEIKTEKAYQPLETVLTQVENHSPAEKETTGSFEVLEKLIDSLSFNQQTLVASQEKVTDLVSDIVKKVRELSPLEQANQYYAEAMAMAEQHNIAGAIDLLNKILQDMPEFKDARETLAAIYIKQKKYQKAEDLLTTGLALDPDYPPFVSLEARILAENGKIKQALAVLNNLSPPISEYPDYYAFLAALNQQDGNYLVSAKIYDELIAIQPDNGLWYLGKAIGLNANGDSQEALRAYQRAQASANLTPPLRAYVDEQIKSLE